MTAAAYRVRTIDESDWATLRAVRLRALLDSPTSFETLHTEAASWPVQRWRSRARGSSRARDVIAFAGDDAVGMAGVYVEDDGDGEVISVWVDPDHRGRGVARLLVTAAMAWARAAGVTRFRLWVTNGNEPAQILYERLGFAATGRRQPLSSRPGLEELQMAVEVPAA